MSEPAVQPGPELDVAGVVHLKSNASAGDPREAHSSTCDRVSHQQAGAGDASKCPARYYDDDIPVAD